MTDVPTTTNQFCTFVLKGLYFGVDVLEVQEVLRFQRMTRVPLASNDVRGLINLRGDIVTAIDLRARFGLEAMDSDQAPMNVVVRTDAGAIALLVDEIGDVFEVDPSTYEPPPPTLQGPLRSFVSGVYKLDGKLLLILNIDATLHSA